MVGVVSAAVEEPLAGSLHLGSPHVHVQQEEQPWGQGVRGLLEV